MKKTITFELQGTELEKFERAFELSGYISMSRFIRWVLLEEIENYYGKENENN